IKGILQEVWLDNIHGNNLSSLLENKDFPDSPNRVSNQTFLPEPQYGQRLRAYFAAPESGMYQFHLSCDGACVLLIESKMGSLLTRCQNSSKGMNMTAGSFYYVTVLHVVSNASKNVSLSVTKPNGTLLSPIPHEYFVAYRKDGNLSEYIPGDWGEWSACQGGIQIRNRSCQVHPPVYSRLNSSYQLSDTKQCGENGNYNPDKVHVNALEGVVIADELTFSVPNNNSCLQVEIYGWPLDNSTVIQNERYMYVTGISWSRPKVYGGLVTGYKVILHYTDGNRHNWTLEADQRSFSAGMGPNSTYCITVLAFNEAGDGPAAKCINFTTRDGACPISWMRYQDSCYLNVSKPANWPHGTLCVGIRESASLQREKCAHVRPYICERKVAPDPDDLKCEDKGVGLEYRVRYDSIFFASSSLLNKYRPGNARLAGEEAWCPNTNSTEEYLEIDLGSLYKICALATQGLLERGAFTKTYRLQFSIDGSKWDWYINENSQRQASPPTGAPTNLTTEIISLTTVQVSWNFIPDFFDGGLGVIGYWVYYYIKGAGAEGLEQQKKDVQDNSTKLFNLKLNATYCISVVGYSEAGEGPRSECTDLHTPAVCLQGWSSYGGNCYRASEKSEGKIEWSEAADKCYNLNSHLVSIYSESENQFVKSLTEREPKTCSWIGLKFKTTRHLLAWNDGSLVNFTKLKDQENVNKCVAYHEESEVWEKKWCSGKCSFVCKRKDFAWPHQNCSDMPLGLENRAIPDYAMQSTNTLNGTSPYDARLSSTGGWCAFLRSEVYLEVNLQSPHFICAIGTQGGQSKDYVKKYKVELANRNSKYEVYKENGIFKEFEANSDYNRVQKNLLESGVVTQYVKLRPLEWHRMPCLRLEIYGQINSERVPTRAPDSVSFSVEDGGLQVRWSLLPVYFHGDVLDGYKIEVKKPNNSIHGIWTFSAEEKSQKFPGITKRADIGCVLVYGFTKYGDSVSSGCAIEEQGEGSGNNSILYTQWSEWSSCSKSCDRGVQFRNRTCASPCSYDSPDPILDQPSNLTTVKSSPNSLAVQWKPYAGNNTLVAYRVLVLRMRAWKSGKSRKRRSIPDKEGELLRNFTVGPNVTAFEIGNLSASTGYCIRIGAITEELGEESLSDCYYLYTEKRDVSLPPPPEANATTNGSSSITIHWKPVLNNTDSPIVGYAIFLRDTNRSIFVESCLTNITVNSSGCIEMASLITTGWGNTTGCLQTENSPTPTPEPVVNETAPKVTASIRRSLATILVTWDPKTISGIKGEFIGYDLEYKLIEVNGIPKDDALWTSLMFSCYQSKTEFNLTDLLPFARYEIKMAVITSEGIGKYSEAVYGATCACAEFITARSAGGIKDSKQDTITSALTKVISDLLLDTCGKCEDYTTKIIYSNKSDDSNGLINFPVSKTSYGQSEYSKFVPVITVPGVLVITRKSDLSKVLTQVASGSALSSWPIAVVTVVMATLAGIIIWFLDSKENSEQFPRQFVKGAGQGFWWSFISMTTVGYGDLCPKSIPGKLFAMIWFLIGLVIFSVFMGTLTSLLTVTTVRKTIGSPQGTDVKTVAVVADSPEQRVAVGSLSSKVNLGKQFPDVEHLVRALKDRAIESIMVDMYTPVKRKDLFNGSWYEIGKLLEVEISHGVLLHGHAVSLVEELKKMIIAKDVQSEYLQDANENAEDEGEILEEEPVTFFEPASPYFRTTMYTTLAALGVCFCCGMLYQAFFYKRRRAPGNRINNNAVVPENTASVAQLETAVKEFYSSFSSTYKELKKKFKAELIHLEKVKRQGGKNLIKKNFQIFESKA
ncbi:hypothetical protein pdam_00013141, partial [Pocillopora damicornis]